MTDKRRPDYILLALTGVLLLIGLLILSSVSAFLAEKNLANPYYFLLHQVFFGIILGGVLGLIFFKLRLELFKNWSFILLLANIGLLALVFFPSIGWQAGGATRWLKIGSLTFQPSEPLKITFILYLAAWLSSRPGASSVRRAKASLVTLGESFFPFLIILGVISLLLVSQPDIGTLIIIGLVAILMYFTSNTPLWHTLLILLLAVVALVGLIETSSYRLDRLLVFIDPDIDPMGIGYQLKQSLIAVGSGGLWGRGLGLSQQKLGFLPQPLGDSIFVVFAEEAGFLGVTFLIILFSLFLGRGVRISKLAPDPFYKLLALGITSQIVLQAFINIASLTGLLPLTGIPLPFISYGGSALATELAGVGILLNISQRD